MLNYYHILGVSTDATTSEIKAAFKKLAIRYHPDKNPNDKNAEEQFKIINEAYQVLNDGYKKSIYDQKLFYKEDITSKSFKQSTQYTSSTYKKTYTTFRRRAYKNSTYDPRLHLIVFGGFIAALVLGWLIFRFIETQAGTTSYEEALKLYKNKAYEAAFIKVHQAVVQDDSNIQAYYLRGILLSEYKKDKAGAIYCFDRCIIYGQDETKRTPNTIGILSDFYFQRGLCYYAKTNFTQALSDFDHTLRVEPTHEKALLLSGDIYLNKYNKIQLAYNYYAKLLQLNPTHEEALLNRAILFYYAHRYTSAKSEFDKIIEKKPQEGKAYYFLGRIQLGFQGDSSKACTNFQKASVLGITHADFFIKKLCTKMTPIN